MTSPSSTALTDLPHLHVPAFKVETVVKTKKTTQDAIDEAQRALKLRSRAVDYVLRLRMTVQQQIHRLSNDKVKVKLLSPQKKVHSIAVHITKHTGGGGR
jgi:hypothetical protein